MRKLQAAASSVWTVSGGVSFLHGQKTRPVTSKQYGCLPFAVFAPSRGPTLLLVPPLRTVRESFQLTRLKFPGTLRS